MDSRRSSPAFVELLRLCIVVLAAGTGYEIGRAIEPRGAVLGPFGGVALGVILGSGVGYVLGGVVGRTTIDAVGRVETSLRDVPAESMVAGATGGFLGLLTGAALSWPLFLLPDAYVGIPLFFFVVAVIGLLGFKLAVTRATSVVGIVGARSGLSPRPIATAALPRIVDTSVAVDGRILEVVRAGFLHGEMIVPSPVLAELQGLADGAEDSRRAKGRRGLETLEALKREKGVFVEVLDDEVPGVHEVDAKLVRLCLDRKVALLTLDTNLAKTAALAGVRVLNLHALTLALRPAVSSGDEVAVLLIKAGKEAGQAVGYLDDGTMVVAERSRALVGKEAYVRVTSVLTTANGRMVFAEPATASKASARATP